MSIGQKPPAHNNTAIRHYLACFQHEGKTATWAGNSPNIIQRHYKGVVKAGDAKEFWSIAPESLESEIIALPTKRVF